MQTALPRGLRLVVALSLGGLAACSFDPEPPAAGTEPPLITCATDQACPQGWLCSRSLGRCVRLADRDDVPPALDGAPTLTPRLGTVGQAFTLTFQVTEPLGEDPAVRLDIGGGRVARWSLVEDESDRPALRYVYRYLATGSEDEGTRLVTLDLVDPSGNAVANLSAGSLVLDFTRPRVVSADVTPALAAAGTSVVLELELSEPLPAPPALELVHPDGTRRALPHEAQTGATSHRYAFTPDGQEPEGEAVVQATGSDEAGNRLEAPRVATLRLDFTAPTLLRTLVAPPVARAGQRVLVEVDLAEEFAAGGTLVAVDLSAGAAGTHAWPEVSRASSRLRFEHTVAVNTDGRYRLELRDVTDLAGNRAATLVVGEVQYDTTAPGVVRVATDAPRYSAQAGHDVVTVTFEVDDALADGTLDVRLGGKPMTCGPWQATAPTFTCTATADGSEPEGLAVVAVRAIDAAGNEGVGSALVRLDFTPPRLVPGTVELSLSPRAGCPVPQVTRWGARATARVSFVLDEAVGATPVVETSAPEVLTFQLLGGAATSFSFGHTLGSAALAQGAYTLEATVVDEVGNATTLPLSPVTPLLVDTAAPTLQVDQTAVRYVRSPWGSNTPEDLGGFTLRAGPLFELAPAEPLSGQATFPASTFAVDDGALLRLEVWADGQRGSLIGSTAANADGSWPRLQLANLDTPAAWLSGLDEACNESAAVRLERAEWVATPRPPPFGVALHRAWTSPRVAPTLEQAFPLAQQVTGSSLAGLEQIAEVAEGAPGWAQLPAPSLAAPYNSTSSGLSAPMAAFDSRRGRVVFFSAGAPRQTWEWDGLRWLQLAPPGGVPPERRGHAMAYDSVRGRVVMFSGITSVGDTWEWDGSTWTNVTPATGSPAGRINASMAFDSARQRIVLFGGMGTGGTWLGDTWEWDGRAWTRRLVSGPSVRSSTAMAYDTARGRVVLFGGRSSAYLADTWEWDGTRWWNVGPISGAPTPRLGHSLAFDPARNRVLLFGGNGPVTLSDGGVSNPALNDLWEWDGAQWQEIVPAGSSTIPRFQHPHAFDSHRGRLVVFGGGSYSPYPGSPTDTWEWDGQRWHDATPSTQTPPAFTNHAMAWDSDRQRVVLFGGAVSFARQQQTWEYGAGQWRLVTPLTTSPAARQDTAMAYDPVRRRVVLFGGDVNGSSTADTWEWDGRDWYNVTPSSGNPGGRYRHALAWDPVRGRVILFGGLPGYQDTWEWNGSSWTNITPAGSPSARWGPALATDLQRQRVVLFGGRTTSSPAEKQDTWEWNGATWTELTPATGNPAPRSRHALAYDPFKRRVTLFGGGTANGSTYYGDTWDWDGARWTQVLPQPARTQPSGRYDYALASSSDGVLLFGGRDPFSYGDTWLLDASPSRPPAIGFSALAAGAGAGVVADRLESVRVRAHCGGAVGSGPGAMLQGWFSGGIGRAAGGWSVLATNATGAATSAPWLPAPPGARLEWTSASAAEGRSLIFAGDTSVNVRCAPLAAPGLEFGRVAMDYVEVRLRYRTQ